MTTWQLFLVCATVLALAVIGALVFLSVVASRRPSSLASHDLDGREVVMFLKDGQSIRGIAETNGDPVIRLHDAALMSGTSATRLKGIVHIAPTDTMAVQVLEREKAE